MHKVFTFTPISKGTCERNDDDDFRGHFAPFTTFPITSAKSRFAFLVSGVITSTAQNVQILENTWKNVNRTGDFTRPKNACTISITAAVCAIINVGDVFSYTFSKFPVLIVSTRTWSQRIAKMRLYASR